MVSRSLRNRMQGKNSQQMFYLTKTEARGTCTNFYNIGTSDTIPTESSLPVAFNVSIQSRHLEIHTHKKPEPENGPMLMACEGWHSGKSSHG